MTQEAPCQDAIYHTHTRDVNSLHISVYNKIINTYSTELLKLLRNDVT